MWNWHDGKVALEYLFWAGRVTAARRVNFERLLRPARAGAARGRCSTYPDAARRARRSASSCGSPRGLYGVATEPDLGDYFRLPRAESKLRVAELVEAGELVPVEVDGWRAPGLSVAGGAPPTAGHGAGAAEPVRLR